MPSVAEPPGTVDREPESSLGKRIASMLFGVPFAAIFLSFFVGVQVAIALGVVAVATVAVLSRDSLQAAVNWNPPVIQVASQGYALGSTPTITYRRKPKRVRDISNCQVECRLVCQERVTYRQGSETKTETRDMYESIITNAGEGAASGLVATLDLDISAHLGAPTFDLSSNEVRWFVEVAVSGPGLPKDSHTFVIDVAASLDPRYRMRVQDT